MSAEIEVLSSVSRIAFVLTDNNLTIKQAGEQVRIPRPLLLHFLGCLFCKLEPHELEEIAMDAQAFFEIASEEKNEAEHA